MEIQEGKEAGEDEGDMKHAGDIGELVSGLVAKAMEKGADEDACPFCFSAEFATLAITAFIRVQEENGSDMTEIMRLLMKVLSLGLQAAGKNVTLAGFAVASDDEKQEDYLH